MAVEVAFGAGLADTIPVSALGVAVGPPVLAVDMTRGRLAVDGAVGAVLAGTDAVMTVELPTAGYRCKKKRQDDIDKHFKFHTSEYCRFVRLRQH